MSALFAIFGLGPMEVAVLGVIAVVLFGRKLPDVARSIDKSVTEFKEGMRGPMQVSPDGVLWWGSHSSPEREKRRVPLWAWTLVALATVGLLSTACWLGL